jgi:hypothetical protein
MSHEASFGAVRRTYYETVKGKKYMFPAQFVILGLAVLTSFRNCFLMKLTIPVSGISLKLASLSQLTISNWDS